MKKLLCVVLCLCFVLLCSCGRDNTKNPGQTVSANEPSVDYTVQEDEIVRNVTLGYFAHESLNPYTTSSKTNRNILTLVYDSLFKLDSSYKAVPVIAKDFEQEGTVLKVELKDDLIFSNSSPLVAADVVYSFGIAKESDFYKNRLAIFESAYANGNEVVFNLSRENIYAVNCLDFPIVSSASGEDELPLGSGRYVLEKEDDGYVLEKNEANSRSEEMENKTIRLFDINETENEYNLLQIGDLTFAYDDFASQTEENKIEANTVSVGLNNLVYLAFNGKSEIWKDESVKKAVISLVDRTAFTFAAYGANAIPCALPFNPLWNEAQDCNFSFAEADSVQAKQLLEDDGYIYAYANNDVRSKNYEFLSLRFIVCESDSRKVLIAKDFAKAMSRAGIGVDLSVLSFEEYKERLQRGKFDIYLGEIKLTNDMNLSPFFSENGAANFGIDQNSACTSAYYDFCSGKIDISTFIGVFDECTPFVPVCFRTGVAYYSKELQFEGSISENDIFSNIYSWVIN